MSFMQNVIYAECHYAECHYAECCGARISSKLFEKWKIEGTTRFGFHPNLFFIPS
jgi:hypothetical protein